MRQRLLGLSTLACLTFVASAAGGAPFFSIDSGSPSVPGVSQNDVLAPGPIGGPPAVATPAAALGLPAGADELDAMTTGAPFDPAALVFSVDRAAVGAPGTAPDVASEAAAGQAAGDVYLAFLGFGNTLLINQDSLGELPAIAPGTPTAGPIDDLDALDFLGPFPSLFSLASGNGFGFSGADLLSSPVGGPPGVAISAAALGLVFADDIDALHLDTASGDCLFSLAAGSPSLGGLGAGPEDILSSPGCGGGAPFVAFAGIGFGLAPGDELNALAIIPEPGSALLLAAGLAALSLRRRRTA